METFEVVIWLKGNSQPIEYDALARYEQVSYTCIVYLKDGGRRVVKYPTTDVFRVEEEYKYIGHQSVRAKD